MACLDNPRNECLRAADCRTLPMWERLNRLVSDFLDGITIADLMIKEQKEQDGAE